MQEVLDHIHLVDRAAAAHVDPQVQPVDLGVHAGGGRRVVDCPLVKPLLPCDRGARGSWRPLGSAQYGVKKSNGGA